MRFVLTSDRHEFAERARPLLSRRIECNVHATVLDYLLAGHYADVASTFACGVAADGEVRFAALRTPPWFMLATELDEPSSARELVEQWLARDPDLPGVNAVPATARAIAAAWGERTGGQTHCRVNEAIHVLDRVSDELRPAAGGLRRATAEERALLVDWMRAFATENNTVPVDQAESMVELPSARGALMVWDDDGAVSMAAFSPKVAGVVRIGPVYTPPAYRARGYATNLVAAVSRQLLADGADRCMLFTDLSNPTSNKIYADIGYRRVADWEEHAFTTRASSTT